MSKVHVATYDHKHGSDIRVFATDALAMDWRTELATEYWTDWNDNPMPEASIIGDTYFNDETISEWFAVEETEVEGNPADLGAIRMRDILADLMEWQSVMGGFEAKPWVDAETMLNELRAINETEGEVKTDFSLAVSKTANSHWANDPDFPPEDWRYEVANDDTRLGYADWVANMKEHAAEDAKNG